MIGITLDESLRARLNGLNTIVPVRDEAGAFVGYFVPQETYDTMFEAWANSEVTESELGAARQEYREHGGLTTAEAIAYIKRLAGEPSDVIEQPEATCEENLDAIIAFHPQSDSTEPNS
jgi:hypothetical protein